MRDLDGDGYADHISAVGGRVMLFKRLALPRLLRLTVTAALGATITLDYTRAGDAPPATLRN